MMAAGAMMAPTTTLCREATMTAAAFESWTVIRSMVDDLEPHERDALFDWWLAQINPNEYPAIKQAIGRIVRDRKPASEVTPDQV